MKREYIAPDVLAYRIIFILNVIFVNLYMLHEYFI